MNHQARPAIRLNPANPDHHLWNNNGTWFVHYTIHPTPFTKQRVRKSLQTKNLTEARLRRDQLLFGARTLSRISLIGDLSPSKTGSPLCVARVHATWLPENRVGLMPFVGSWEALKRSQRGIFINGAC